jgi:hypothetical protein
MMLTQLRTEMSSKQCFKGVERDLLLRLAIIPPGVSLENVGSEIYPPCGYSRPVTKVATFCVYILKSPVISNTYRKVNLS